MTHGEARRLLASYAAGELAAAEAADVRAHLVAGCTECLAAVFRLPLKQYPEHGGPPRGNGGPITSASGGSQFVRGAIVVAVSAVAVAGIWGYARVRSEVENASRREHARIVELEATQAAIATRAEHLEAERIRAEADAARLAEAVRAAAEVNAALRRELEGVQAWRDTVGVHESCGEQRLVGTDTGRLLAELASQPGVEVVALAPVAPRSQARGHLVRHAGRPEMVLCAVGLPPLPSSAFYRVRVLVSGGWVEDGTAFRPRPDGRIVFPLRTPGAMDALRGIEIVSEPDGTQVLGVRLPETGE